MADQPFIDTNRRLAKVLAWQLPILGPGTRRHGPYHLRWWWRCALF